MIDNKAKLKYILKKEKALNYDLNLMQNIKSFISKDPRRIIYLFIKYYRKEEYFYNSKKNVLFHIYKRKRRKLGLKLGFTMDINCIDEGLIIYHYGNIVINSNAKIGKNCKLHGNNCIGNDGKNIDIAPIIGDNVDIGYGSNIIGDVKIGNNVKIGASACVVNSFNESNITLVGVPAKRL